MSFARAALSGSAWSLGQMVVERGLQAALFFIVAKLLGPTEFGIAAISISLPMVFVATMAGVLQIVIQRRTLTDGFLLSTFWLALAIGGVFTLVSMLLAPLVAHFVGVPDLVRYMSLAAFAPLITALGVVGEGMLTHKLEFRLLALRRMIGLLVAAPACVALAVAGYGPWSLIANTLLTSFISAIVALWGSGFRPQMKIDRRELSDVARSAFYTCLAQASIGANTRLVDMLIGVVAGPEMAGNFRLARTVIDLVLSVTYQPIANILLPVMARVASDPTRSAAAFARIVFISGIILGTPALGLFAVAEGLAVQLIGQKWAAAGPLLAWMALAYPAAAIISPIQAFCTAKGMFRFGLWITLLDLGLNIVFLGIGATQGATALGAMFSLRAMAAAAIILYLMLNVDPDLRWKPIQQAMRPLWIALALVVLLCIVRDAGSSAGIWGMVVLGAAILAAYGLAIIVFCRKILIATLDAFPMPMMLRRFLDRILRTAAHV